MLMVNRELAAISLSGLHDFHKKAFLDIVRSMRGNTTLQTVDLGIMKHE
jgi:hypothetical protein